MRLKIISFVLLAIQSHAFAIEPPKGFQIPTDSQSPDHQYGVTVPILSEWPDSADPKNSLIDLKTGHIIANIESPHTGWSRMAHGGVLPARWSKDGTLLLWEVEGKWFPWAMVLIKQEKGTVSWQVDILKNSQEAILKRTKEAAPKQYAKAKEATKGNGSAYPEGFTVDVKVEGEISLPLQIKVTLTSNPKRIEDFPTLDSRLDAIIDPQGNFIPKGFYLGKTN